MSLVLSLFPGIGLLDMGFEAEGFCVVRGPNLLWGGDIKRFHPPTGRFNGVIGGSPCQRFTRLAALIRHNGYELAEDLVPEFERVVAEASPQWFLHENVRGAPIPSVPGYLVDPRILNARWLGEEQSREHRMSFGTHDGRRLDISTSCAALEHPRWSPRVLASGGTSGCLGPRRHKKHRTDLHRRLRSSSYFETAKRLQGLSADFDLPAFKVEEKIRALGNAVPLPLGLAVARGVKAALSRGEATA